MQRMPLEKRLLIAGPAREDGPAAFRLYAATFADKDEITALISAVNFLFATSIMPLIHLRR